ncbi:MAG: BsuPI-related putative proteinase inhibitor [Nitrososphaerota archaeon]|nr:BsuPI-related putative proteinase inhibitor [Nitrososphaerales archaeon]MDW8045518.1 BsuPI-related putative proteinase inhibitor [Nitrososphaerota archaeon]
MSYRILRMLTRRGFFNRIFKILIVAAAIGLGGYYTGLLTLQERNVSQNRGSTPEERTEEKKQGMNVDGQERITPSEIGEVSTIRGQLRLTMKAPLRIKEGQPLNVILELANIGDEAVTILYTSGQKSDFVVYKDGDEVYRWSSDKLFIQAIIEKTLQPGQSIIDALSSSPKTFSRGSYTLIGESKALLKGCYTPRCKESSLFLKTPPLHFEVIPAL